MIVHPACFMNIIILDISIAKYIRSIRFFLYTQYIYTECRVISPSPKLAVSESGFATRTDYHLVLQLGEMRIRRQYFVEYKFCENKMMWSSDNKCGSWCKHHCDTWYEFMTFIFVSRSCTFSFFCRFQLTKKCQNEVERVAPGIRQQ